jgi:hypothetical protein
MLSPPLWYQVCKKQFSFKEFLDRYHDTEFQECDVLPIFILSVLYNHDPYIKGVHIIHTLMQGKGISERALKYIYLYWTISKGFGDDLILDGTNLGGNFRKYMIKFPANFSEDYIYDWIGIILKSFFNILIYIPNMNYCTTNKEILIKALKYSGKAHDDRFSHPFKSTEKFYKLAIAHDSMNELVQFFKSGSYPFILNPYRKNRNFFRTLVTCFSPTMLKSAAPFSSEELLIIEEEHKNLYDKGDVDFFIHYIESFSNIFEPDHPLTIQIKKYINPSAENDRIRIEHFLRSKNPMERSLYFLQYFPVTDMQLNRFIDHVKREGVVNALKPYIMNNKYKIEQELFISGCELASDVIISTQHSIFLYSTDQLIFHAEDNKIYIFLPEELNKFEERKNPYNRKPLPEYLYLELYEDHKTDNLEELWTKILRHTIDLQ